MSQNCDTIGEARRLFALGQLGRAEQICRTLIDTAPGDADAIGLLGAIALQTGRPAEAVVLLRRAAELRPEAAEIHATLGPALQQMGQFDEAIAACRKAIELKPGFAGAHQNLAQALLARRQWAGAEDACRRAIAIDARYVPLYNTLAVALHAQGRLPEAQAVCRRAIELSPRFHAPWNTLGMVLQDQGRLREAIAACERAIDLNPASATAHYNCAMALLLSGDLRRGFAEYEWRWRCAAGAIANRFDPRSRWDGEELAGRPILLHAEQGLGDTIQFARYVPLVAGRGGRVTVACQPELCRLMTRLDGVTEIRPVAEVDELPPSTLHLPMGSLPHVFGTTLDSIPPGVPYLGPDAALASQWRSRLGGDRRLKVGIAWAGNPDHPNDHNRSINSNVLLPLLGTTGVSFYSIQKNAIHAVGMIDFTHELEDLADTAALIENLDLVISVDTCVAHLAGATARPVWVLLPFAPDWRWMRDRTDTPWYPTARLFRQPGAGIWSDVVERVRQDLELLAKRSV